MKIFLAFSSITKSTNSPSYSTSLFNKFQSSPSTGAFTAFFVACSFKYFKVSFKVPFALICAEALIIANCGE